MIALIIDTTTQFSNVVIINSKCDALSNSINDNLINNHLCDSGHYKNYTLKIIDEALMYYQITKKDLNYIVYNKGPGRFISTRTGAAIAISMAMLLDIPLLSITTLDIYAWYISKLYNTKKFIIAKKIKSQGIYYACYHGFKQIGNHSFISLEDVYKINPDYDRYLVSSEDNIEGFKPIDITGHINSLLKELSKSKIDTKDFIDPCTADVLYPLEKIALNIEEQRLGRRPIKEGFKL